MAFCSTERCGLKVLVKKGLVMPSSVRAGAGQGFGFSGIWELVILVLSAWLGLPWSSGREVRLPFLALYLKSCGGWGCFVLGYLQGFLKC